MVNFRQLVDPDEDIPFWGHGGTNLCLDFHGDPANAALVIFSDGNHHMALAETLNLFKELFPKMADIFYATTPPGPILTLLKHGRIKMGNLVLSVKPDLFISPPQVLDTLVAQGLMSSHIPFVKNKGNVILIKKGNPKNILNVGDLERSDIKIFMSNPHTESTSYLGYEKTINSIASEIGLGESFIQKKSTASGIVYGDVIHHREAPHAVAGSMADAAIIYYHLALYYTRIFPSVFEYIPLGGTTDLPEPYPSNSVSLTHAGLIRGHRKQGRAFFEFLQTREVAQIYAEHGLESLILPGSQSRK